MFEHRGFLRAAGAAEGIRVPRPFAFDDTHGQPFAAQLDDGGPKLPGKARTCTGRGGPTARFKFANGRGCAAVTPSQLRHRAE